MCAVPEFLDFPWYQVMADYLTEQEHAELAKALESGDAKLSFTRTLARQFYLRVGAKSISYETGQNTHGQKFLINLTLTVSMLLFVTSLALAINELGWVGLFVVTLLGVFWTILAGFTTEMGSITHSMALLVITLIAAYFLPASYGPIALSFGLSVFLFRISHMLAFYFLYRLISQSWDTYNHLYEQIDVERS